MQEPMSSLSNVANLGSKPISHNTDAVEHLLKEKDETISQLKDTVEILELKIKKLDQLVKLKDAKISNLTNKLNSVGIM